MAKASGAKASFATPKAVAVAAVKKDKDEERQHKKNAWSRFYRALKHADDGNLVRTYESVQGKALREKFMHAWQQDPSWGFVSLFKCRSVVSTEGVRLEREYKTFSWLCKELGKKGAKKHCAKMKSAKLVRVHKTAGIKTYAFDVERETNITENRLEKRVECKAEVRGSAARTALGQQKRQLAIEDGGLDSNFDGNSDGNDDKDEEDDCNKDESKEERTEDEHVARKELPKAADVGHQGGLCSR
jgi:hypothetical protein